MNAATPQHRPVTEVISGLIERVTFHNDQNGFCVLCVKTPGHREETGRRVVTVCDCRGVVGADDWWVRDKEHGLQFKASSAPPGRRSRGAGRRTGTMLAPGQREALKTVLGNLVVVMTGTSTTTGSFRG